MLTRGSNKNIRVRNLQLRVIDRDANGPWTPERDALTEDYKRL